jgi:hypothetical protein
LTVLCLKLALLFTYTSSGYFPDEVLISDVRAHNDHIPR